MGSGLTRKPGIPEIFVAASRETNYYLEQGHARGVRNETEVHAARPYLVTLYVLSTAESFRMIGAVQGGGL